MSRYRALGIHTTSHAIMELDDLILSMINMTGIETDMVRDVENIRFESTVYRNNGRWG